MTSLSDLDPLAALGIVGSRPAPGTLGYEELKRRQAIATAMAGGRRREFPKTFGEGLTSLGEAVGERMNDDRIAKMAAAQRGAEGGVLKGGPATLAPGVGGGLAVPPVATAPAAAAPVAAPPATFGGKPYTEVPVRKSEGEDESSDLKDKLAALLLGNGGEVPQTNPTPGADLPPLTTDMQALPTQEAGGQPDLWAARQGGIGGIETGGRGDPYRTLGAVTRTGDRAHGKYGMMGNNIPEWTEAALGRRMTPEQFLADDKAQDATFKHRFGQYADKYGEEGAARAWYGGERGMKNLGATDVHGRLTVGGYGQDYMNRLRGGGTQVASLGGTVSDAPSPGVLPLPQTVTDEQEPTPTDIKPMPVRTAQMNVPPSGVLPGASMMSSDFTRGAPSPSSQPIPPETTEKPPVVRPEPKQPEIMGPTKAMEYWSRYMNNPNVSPELQAHAKKIHDTEAHYVKELQQRRDANFVHERQQRDAETLRLETWQREAPVRKIDTHIKRLQIEKTLATTPLEVAKLNGEIKAQEIAREKAAYEITQRGADERSKRASTLSTERTVATPHRVQLQGTEFVSPYIPESGTFGPLTVAPGAPAPEEKAPNETQAKGIAFYMRVRDDIDNVKTKMGHGKALTEHLEHAKWNAPGVPESIRNSLISNEYRAAKDALGNWGAAFLHNVSGATVTPAEALIQLPAFVPRPGDTPQDLLDKSRRRDAFTDAAKQLAGEPGRRALEQAKNAENDRYLFQKNSEKPDVRVNSPEEAAKLEPGQWFITHDGRRKQRGK